MASSTWPLGGFQNPETSEREDVALGLPGINPRGRGRAKRHSGGRAEDEVDGRRGDSSILRPVTRKKRNLKSRQARLGDQIEDVLTPKWPDVVDRIVVGEGLQCVLRYLSDDIVDD